MYARWLGQEAPQASAGEGKVARALAVALAKIADGGDVNATDKTGHTALMMAAAIDHRPAIDFLLLSGADPYLKNAKGRTAMDMTKQDSIRELMKASAIMDKDREDMVLESGADSSSVLPGKRESFGEYARKLHSGALPEILKGSESNTGNSDMPRLLWLSMAGDANRVLLQLKNGSNPSTESEIVIDGGRPYKTTPLHAAASVADFRTACLLIAAGADVTKASWVRNRNHSSASIDEQNPIPPLLACGEPAFTMEERLHIDEFLRAVIVETLVCNYGVQTALEQLAAEGAGRLPEQDLWHLVKKAGKKLSRLGNKESCQLFIRASEFGGMASFLVEKGLKKEALLHPDSGVVQGLLLKAGVSPDAAQVLLRIGIKPKDDKEGLQLACMAGDGKALARHIGKAPLEGMLLYAANATVARSLLKAGADAGEKDEYGDTLVSRLCWIGGKGSKEVLPVLLEAGAAIPENTLSSMFQNPVQDAGLACLLIKAGAAINYESAGSSSPKNLFCYPSVLRYPEVVSCLLEAGAKTDVKVEWGTGGSPLSQARQAQSKLAGNRLWLPGENALLHDLQRTISLLEQAGAKE